MVLDKYSDLTHNPFSFPSPCRHGHYHYYEDYYEDEGEYGGEQEEYDPAQYAEGEQGDDDDEEASFNDDFLVDAYNKAVQSNYWYLS